MHCSIGCSCSLLTAHALRRVWDVGSSSCKAILEHDDVVKSVAISGPGKLMSCSGDTELRCARLNHHVVIVRLLHEKKQAHSLLLHSAGSGRWPT